jgi:hypothetical protein
MKKTCVMIAGLALAAGAAQAQVNGQYKAAYGSAVAVQQNATGFGDSNLGQINFANGSELNAAFFSGDATNANLLFTGNLESNFNKFVIFLDNGGGGQNTITGGASLPGNYTGMKFDTGFSATHWISITCGGNFGMFVDGGNLLTNTGGYLGGNDGQSGGVLGLGGNNTLGLAVALDNSNVLGVTSGSAAGALSATTGIEVQIPWASLGLAPGSTFKAMGFINGSNHDFVSNQLLGSLASGTGNLGGNVGGIDFSALDGDQFFVVPAPSSAALVVAGGLVAMRRRRA